MRKQFRHDLIQLLPARPFHDIMYCIIRFLCKAHKVIKCQIKCAPLQPVLVIHVLILHQHVPTVEVHLSLQYRQYMAVQGRSKRCEQYEQYKAVQTDALQISISAALQGCSKSSQSDNLNDTPWLVAAGPQSSCNLLGEPRSILFQPVPNLTSTHTHTHTQDGAASAKQKPRRHPEKLLRPSHIPASIPEINPTHTHTSTGSTVPIYVHCVGCSTNCP